MGAISLAELAENRRVILVPTRVGDVDVVYRPSSMTPAAQAITDLEERPNHAYVRTMISSWGLLADNSESEYPRDDAWLKKLPEEFLELVAQAIFDDMEGGENVITNLRRWMVTGGNIGHMPWWYPLIRAARYLRVAPWDLAKQPVVWRTWALQAEASELGAQAEIRKRHQGGS